MEMVVWHSIKMQDKLWRIGSILNSVTAIGPRYQVKQYLGHGSYGLVVKAGGPKGDVAVKVMEIVGKENGLPADMMREVGICKRLKDHAHVVKLEQVFTRHDLMFMVFELCDCTLRSWINVTSEREKETTRSMFEQILSGLVYMHSNRFIHRDLKPENILVKNDVVKIADLGCARALVQGKRVNGEMMPAAYTGGLVTLWYRAPELLWGLEAYGPAVDAWGLGAVGLEMEIGKPAFGGQTEVDVIMKQTYLRGTPTEETWPGVTKLPFFEPLMPQFHGGICTALVEREQPEWFYEILNGLLVMDPHQRATPGDCLEFYHDMLGEQEIEELGKRKF